MENAHFVSLIFVFIPSAWRLFRAVAITVWAITMAACAGGSSSESGITGENNESLCSDGIDNDDNGVVDCMDTGCGALCAQTDSGSDIDDTDPVVVDFDWNGIIGTGQSLALGTVPVTSTTQPFSNLKLDLGTLEEWPFDATSTELSVVPLTEPIREIGSGFPRPYPVNIWGETPHSAMANQISFLTGSESGQEFVSVHTVVAESGQAMSVVSKGAEEIDSTGRAYAASIFEISAIARLASAAGKRFGVGAVVITNGEADYDNELYGDELEKMMYDYNGDLRAVTGQEETIQMFVSQMHCYPGHSASKSIVSQQQWELSRTYPHLVVLTGPKYQYEGYGDGVHLSAHGYRQYGDKLGQIYYERIVRKRNWQPLHPISATKEGNTITVQFHVPNLPLVFDEVFAPPHQQDLVVWANGRGFEVRDRTLRVAIESVEIVNDTVVITCADILPNDNVSVAYAMTASEGETMTGGALTARWGQLRDSDPFVGYTSGDNLPNWAVAFEIPVE